MRGDSLGTGESPCFYFQEEISPKYTTTAHTHTSIHFSTTKQVTVWLKKQQLLTHCLSLACMCQCIQSVQFYVYI